jgi:hypothetical protein
VKNTRIKNSPYEQVGLVEPETGGYAADFSTRSATGASRTREVGPSPSSCRSVKTPLSDSLAETLLREGLPPPSTRRWVVRRKAAVVVAVSSGKIAVEEACQIYQLTEEELLSWKHAFERHGLAGLRTTRIQQYRRGRSRRIFLPRR